MATVGIVADRRAEPRRSAADANCKRDALLRPGQPVLLLNINTRAALVESDARLRPGVATELQLSIGDGRTSVRGRLDRCYVAGLAPLRYRGLLVFDHRFALAGHAGGNSQRAAERHG